MLWGAPRGLRLSSAGERDSSDFVDTVASGRSHSVNSKASGSRNKSPSVLPLEKRKSGAVTYGTADATASPSSSSSTGPPPALPPVPARINGDEHVPAATVVVVGNRSASGSLSGNKTRAASFGAKKLEAEDALLPGDENLSPPLSPSSISSAGLLLDNSDSRLRHCTWQQAAFNVFFYMFGASQVPYAMGQMGWSWGIACLVALTVSSWLSGHLLVDICERRFAYSWPDVAREAYGRAGWVALQVRANK
jgi:hypothetical protein